MTGGKGRPSSGGVEYHLYGRLNVTEVNDGKVTRIAQFTPTEKQQEAQEKYNFILTHAKGCQGYIPTSVLPYIIQRRSLAYCVANINILCLIKLQERYFIFPIENSILTGTLIFEDHIFITLNTCKNPCIGGMQLFHLQGDKNL